jgi:hypothetical protein
MSIRKSKLVIFYFFTSEFPPSLLMELEIKIVEQFRVQEIDKAISNIAVILSKKEYTLMSHGR